MERLPLLAVSLSLFSMSCGGESLAHGDVPYVAAALSGPDGDVGMAHLKLHDDLGDLELRLFGANEASRAQLPLDTAPRVTFFGRGAGGADRTVVLGPRDNDTNPDEDGKPNIEDGKTHYFIYPRGDEDSAWLRGEDFECEVRLDFEMNGKPWASERFTLVPHSHGAADGHSHD